HTECGMMSAHAETLVQALKDKGIEVDNVPVDPSLPELTLASGAFAKWIRMFDDVDEICARQVEYVRNHPLIPAHVTVSGWIWEVETGHLRAPHARLSEQVNTSRAMGAK
ncbi:MAG: carbonic anhydrase, partial [Gammaproteobacteria bacterium]